MLECMSCSTLGSPHEGQINFKLMSTDFFSSSDTRGEKRNRNTLIPTVHNLIIIRRFLFHCQNWFLPTQVLAEREHECKKMSFNANALSCHMLLGAQEHKSEEDFLRTADNQYIAARALATYLIPGCVGRGARLGSENSSGAGGAGVGGVWKSGNLETWLGTWKSRNNGVQKSKNKKKSQNSNPFCPKCRQGLD